MTSKKNFSETIMAVLPIILISIIVGGLCSLVTTYKLEDYERLSYYWRCRLRSRIMNYQNPVNPNIAIIAIDRRTLDEDKLPFMFWSENFLPVFTLLIKNGVKVIGFDFIHLLSPKDALKSVMNREFVSNVKKEIRSRIDKRSYEQSNLDAYIENLVDEVPVIRSEREFEMLMLEKKTILPEHIKPNDEILRPMDDIAFAAGLDHVGVNNLGFFKDDVMVYQRLFFKWKNNGEEFILPSFPNLIIEKFTGKEIKPHGDNHFVFGRTPIKVDKDGRLWINYRRQIDPEKDKKFYFSFIDVLNKAREGNSAYFRDNFGAKIVLIGETAYSNDLHRVPFTDQLVSGMEIHANTITTILDNDYVITLKNWMRWLLLLLLCLTVGSITFKFRPFMAVMICAAFLIVYAACAIVLFCTHSLWLPLFHTISIIPVFAGVYFYKFITEESARNRIKKIFGRYVSKDVMETVLSHPKNLALGGERRKITILFSDINNFTPQSENLAPEELMRQLNYYFEEMNAIIMKYNGTIKQFVGDEIMVMYGAPLLQEDQAVRAVNTAVEMVDKLDEMRRKDPTGKGGFYEVKIGIHAGEVVVGNVGSADRTEYAAVGDNVNMTARIEGLNKKLGTNILISEEIYNEVQGKIENVEFISFEPQEVKGKTKLVKVYEARRSRKGGKS